MRAGSGGDDSPAVALNSLVVAPGLLESPSSTTHGPTPRSDICCVVMSLCRTASISFVNCNSNFVIAETASASFSMISIFVITNTLDLDMSCSFFISLFKESGRISSSASLRQLCLCVSF